MSRRQIGLSGLVAIMKKIKVVHIVPMLAPGGAEAVAVHIVRGLNRQRYDVAVVSLRRWLGCDLERLLAERGVQALYLGKRPGFDCRMFHRLHRALRDHRPDIVHTHLHVLRYALPSMLSFTQVSMVHTVHNLAEREAEPGTRWIQRYAFNHGVVPVAVSAEVAISLERLYRIQRCRMIANCIPTDLYASPRTPRREWRAREGFREDHVLFVCVARLSPQKNHALLLKAFAQGPASDPKAHLVLVGEGTLRRQLEEQAQNLGLAGQIHFLGLRTDISDVLSAMDVFVLSSDYEGSPLSVVEAMASGLPIVSTAAGGVPELFDNGKEGFIVQPGDVRGLSDAIALLLKDREARQSFGIAAARRAKENFDLSRMVRAYEELYENLIGRLHSQKPSRTLPERVTPTEEQLMGRGNQWGA